MSFKMSDTVMCMGLPFRIRHAVASGWQRERIDSLSRDLMPARKDFAVSVGVELFADGIFDYGKTGYCWELEREWDFLRLRLRKAFLLCLEYVYCDKIGNADV